MLLKNALINAKDSVSRWIFEPRYLKIGKVSVNTKQIREFLSGSLVSNVDDGRIFYEEDKMEVARRMFREKPRSFYDIGAGIGHYTLEAISEGVHHVVAFEEDSQKRNVIEEATKRENLNVWFANDKIGLGEKSRKVDSVRLELSIYLDILRVDVPGRESEIMASAVESLNRFRPDLILNVYPEEAKKLGGDTEEMLAMLRKFGYQDYHAPIRNTYFLRYNTP